MEVKVKLEEDDPNLRPYEHGVAIPTWPAPNPKGNNEDTEAWSNNLLSQENGSSKPALMMEAKKLSNVTTETQVEVNDGNCIRVTKSKESGITIHYMSRSKLRQEVNSFRKLGQIVGEENARDRNSKAKEQEQQIKELQQILTETEHRREDAAMEIKSLQQFNQHMHDMLEERAKLYEDASKLSQTRLDEMLCKDERIKDLELQKEELERGYNRQLQEIKLLKDKVNELQESNQSEGEEISTPENGMTSVKWAGALLSSLRDSTAEFTVHEQLHELDDAR